MGLVISGSTNIGYKTSTSGLSLYLDARNQNSYPGSGTTWYDLSVGGNNVSTNNGNPVKYESTPIPNFTSSWLGNPLPPPYSSSYIDYYAPNLTTTATVETVCQIINLNSAYNAIFGWDSYDVLILNPQSTVYFTTLNNDVLQASQTLNVGEWYYFVFEMRSDVSYINNKIYINGVNQTLTSTGGGSEYAPNRNFNGGNGRIASYKAMSQFYNYTGNNRYAMFRVYNRALTQSEITNNYNYYKPIFNLT